MQKLVLPDLYCPFPSQINKYADVLKDYSLEWVLRFKLLSSESLYQRFSKSKFYLLAAGAYPVCKLEELKIANDIISWLFIWDDQCDITDFGKKPELLKIICNRFIEILNGAELTAHDIPLGYALSDIRKRIIQRGGITFFHHFVRSFEDYFHGCIEEAKNRIKVIVPALETYIAIRSASAAAALCINLIEFCDRVTIPYFLRSHEVIDKLTRMTINILAWSNDIFSAPREIANGEIHNLVLVLYHQHKKSLEQAMKDAAAMHDHEVKQLLSLEDKIPSFSEDIDGEIAKYISGLHSWIRGNVDWYAHSGRYQVIEKTEMLKNFALVSSN